MNQNIHYGVIGLGPVGSAIAAFLKQGGKRVSVLCADRHRFRAMMETPVVVSGKLQAQARINDIFVDLRDFVAAKPDVVMIVTKSCDSTELLKSLKAAGLAAGKGDHTVLVSCQNGLDVENQIIDTFGTERALRMVLNFGCSLVNDNEVKVSFVLPHILSLRSEVDAKITGQIANDLSASGFITEVKKDYRTAVFKKAILNASLGSVCALTDMTMKAVMDEPELSRMVRQMVREGIAVAQATGLPIEPSYLDEATAYLSRGGDHKPSILVDIEHGRPTENDYLCGKIFEYAQQQGVEVAVSQTIYYLVKNRERNAIRIRKEGESPQ